MVIPDFIRLAILILVILLNFLLIGLVNRGKNKSSTNNIFTFLSLITTLWLVATYISSDPRFREHYLLVSRFTIFFAPAQSVAFFLLAHTIPDAKVRLKIKSQIIIFFATILVSLLTLSPYVFVGIKINADATQLVPGLGMPFFVIFVTCFSIAAIVTLFKKMRHTKNGVEHEQFKFVLIGILLLLGLIITTIMVPIIFFNNSSFLPFAPAYVLLFLAMTAIAIMKYHLLNIKLIATEAMAVILVVALLFEGLLSGSLIIILFKTGFAIVVGLIGALLVNSVQKEIKQREELGNLAHSLEQANIRLQELDKQKTDFLSIAAHQLRTPLSILNGYIELIADGAYGQVGKDVKVILTNMDESNLRLVKLVDEFLDITRIEQGRTKYDFKPRYINKVIESVVREINDRAKEKGLKLEWDPSVEIPPVECDDEKVRHVIFNFVDNSIKYTDKGKIIITANMEENGLSIRVIDHGFGFERTDEVNFFQKFYRGENVKGTNVNGTGLGLYVCRMFVEAHHGRVWAHSDGLGKGSEFGFWLPLKQ